MKRPRRLNKLAIGLSLIALAAVIAAVGASTWRGLAQGEEAVIVATVNGDPISTQEFNRLLRLNRAGFISEFPQAHGVDFDHSFWEVDDNGESRLDVFKKQTLKEAVKLIMILQLAESRGLIEGSSYDDLLAEMKKENARREAAVQAGQPIYGPVRFDEHTFIDVYISKVVIELKEKLAADEWDVTEEQLKQHYESIKDELFRLEDNIRFYNISIPYREEGQAEDENKRQRAKDRMESVKDLLEQSDSPEEVLEGLEGAEQTPGIRIHEEQLNNETARVIFRTLPELYDTLTASTQAGGVSAVIDDRAAGRYVLAWIIDKETSGYKSFEAVKGSVHKHYVDGKFEAYLNKLVDDADVRLEEAYYKAKIH